MKPHIVFRYGWWWCGTPYHLGNGKTPLAAYAMWEAQQFIPVGMAVG